MNPIRCRACDAVVHVRKSSWQQTSIQWSEASRIACLARESTTPDSATCTRLKACIDAAALSGTLPVLDTESADGHRTR
ncbi:hypothetical protein KO481_37975 [Nocardia sp. NEAU-G5]|uniref:Ferredoxin n=1 Tax=Nocardia albiluteola TaxID=2842303 RepID=A0ABS6BAG6_9NOCA|nr:hypothetical protein [Nocardia albiluteola]MBU3067297.1 hypothetical protein [Nocardia albiluteola]